MNFTDFFAALWTSPTWSAATPFPWQEMLANHAAWPEAIDLPTASGKTACMDAAIYRLATGATGSDGQPMPRRIWFVVDRRIVVDEAFRRAARMAGKLAEATSGPLKVIADKLRAISGTGTPLAVARLRGGTWRDEKGWASDPRQVAIICTTVDQIGSSLLFRAYGHGDLTASIYAGLTGNDSLIILDEAHCSEPFRQTLEAIRRFRQAPWSPETPPVPFAYTIMSATLPEGLRLKAFPSPAERGAALDHDALRERQNAEKLATLCLVKHEGGGDPFVKQAVEAAEKYQASGCFRVAVMVNRVATANAIFNALNAKDERYESVLITGRMRPLDRDKLIEKWSPVLESGSIAHPPRPVIVVTTQCLEVGADFSFDALVTECASLDALRQRFGRLDRLGKLRSTRATILLRAEHATEPDDKDADPIYGKAIFHTWKWLDDIAERVPRIGDLAKKPSRKKNDKLKTETASPPEIEVRVNFGIASLGEALDALEEADKPLEPMLAPRPDAPILLPGHLDLLCQTSPRPAVEPDISLFLHGKERSSAEVRVVFRCDIPEENYEEYLAELALLPPTSPEALTVPLHRIRQWLVDQASQDFTGDVEGESAPVFDPTTRNKRARTFILWRGRKKSKLSSDPLDLKAGDMVVLPAERRIFQSLGQAPSEPDAAGADCLDLAEVAFHQAKGRVILRLHPKVWAPWMQWPKVKELIELAGDEDGPPDRDGVLDAIIAVIEEQHDADVKQDETGDVGDARPRPIPSTILRLLKRIIRRPDGKAFPFTVRGVVQGAVAIGKSWFGSKKREGDPFDDDDSDERCRTRSRTGASSLAEHTAQVRQLAGAFASRCWPALFDDVDRSSFCHDFGKLDPRFQIVLRGGNIPGVDDEPLAKSAELPQSLCQKRQIEENFRLCEGFRHEMLSAQLAEYLHLVQNEMALHLITSHHGHSRPFAPMLVVDKERESQLAAGDLPTHRLNLPAVSATTRGAFPVPHDLQSGHADRFWKLTRKHGWWGLAYAEMLLRLADWEASANPQITPTEYSTPPVLEPLRDAPARDCLALAGIDGANPLGMLSALGVLRSLTHAWPDRDVRLHWEILRGGWKAVVSYNSEPTGADPATEVLNAIASVLKLGFKAKAAGHEEREKAQRDLEALSEQIKQVKASIKKRKLKDGEKNAAEITEIHPLERIRDELKVIAVDPAEQAKKAFDSTKTALKEAVNSLKKQGLRGAEQKAARTMLIEPIEAKVGQLRQTWLLLLREAVPFREMALGKRVDVSELEYRTFAEQSLPSQEWWPVEMLCHFGSDGALNRGTTEPTLLSFINGSGHQFFLETALELTKCVTHEKVRSALFRTWFPEDEKYSMRWLPSEDRRYALMAANPSGGEKTLTVWAANLLGYAGLGLLPSAPETGGLGTVGINIRNGEPVFQWPLWSEPLSALAVSSLLAQKEGTSVIAKRRYSKRIEVGDGANKKINFTPSVAC